MQRKQVITIKQGRFQIRENGLLWGLAVVKLSLYFLAGNLYNYHPQEYYLLSCSHHINWGFVDTPPLSIFLLWLVRNILGVSLWALRLLPALAGAASVFLTGKLVKDLGGSTFAISLAGAGMLLTPWHLYASNMYTPHAFTLFFTVLMINLLVYILDTKDYFYWIPLGLVSGLALLNHYSSIGIILGLFLGTLIFYKKQYLHKEIWFALILILCMLLPHIIWQSENNWPVYVLFKAHVFWQTPGLSAAQFLKNQLFLGNPIVLLLSIIGLIALFFSKTLKDYRILLYIFATNLALLFITGLDDGTGVLGTYPLLLVPGVLVVEQYLEKNSSFFWKPAFMFPLVLFGLIILPLCLPVLPVNGLNFYLNSIRNTEKSIQEIYQKPFLNEYARQISTQEWVEKAGMHYQTISDTGRVPTVLYSDVKTMAAAMEFHRKHFYYTKPISGHNAWWLWGPGTHDHEQMLYISDKPVPAYINNLYHSITPVDTLNINGPFGGNEQVYISLCQSNIQSLQNSWLLLKRYKVAYLVQK